MSFDAKRTYNVPDRTAQVARAIFPKGNPVTRLHDDLHMVVEDRDFADLFPTRGRPAEAPVRLALATLLQFMEGLTDRQAADAVRTRIDWKYLLCLELTDVGFNHTVLSEFRTRLLAHEAEGRHFEAILELARGRGLLKGGGQGTFRDDHLGFVPIDIKHVPKLQTADGERRKRYLFVAIDRCSRCVHLAVKDNETEKSAVAFLREAAAAFPFQLTHVLTDNGSCFTPAFAKACAELGAQYRHTRPRTPQTNGMVERFNGRIASEVLEINVYSHRALEQLLRGFNTAYNARRQHVLNASTPNQIVAEHLKAKPELANPAPRGRTRPCDITKARFIVEAAKEVSQPDS